MLFCLIFILSLICAQFGVNKDVVSFSREFPQVESIYLHQCGCPVDVSLEIFPHFDDFKGNFKRAILKFQIAELISITICIDLYQS